MKHLSRLSYVNCTTRNQIKGEEKFSFREVLQLMKEERRIGLDCHHFATSIDLMVQCLLNHTHTHTHTLTYVPRWNETSQLRKSVAKIIKPDSDHDFRSNYQLRGYSEGHVKQNHKRNSDRKTPQDKAFSFLNKYANVKEKRKGRRKKEGRAGGRERKTSTNRNVFSGS